MEPIFIGKVDYSAAGNGCKMLLGDVNGDGRMEMIFVQPNGGIDDRYEPHQITCVTVFDLNGKMLWQYGTPVDNPGKFGSDFPAQVYDIDGDGRLEILCVIDKTFLILNGMTGRVKKRYDLPSDEAHDCIIIANLTGNEQAMDIIVKDRYETLWALNNEFELLWTHKGNVGHFPWVYDINNDGYDEVMAGYDMLDHNGKVLWSCKNLEDHADCIWMGDVNGDGKIEIAVGGSVTCLYDTEGNELWRHEDSVESQHIALGKFIEEAPGLQIAGLDRIIRGDGHKDQWEGKDGMFLIDAFGETLWKEERKSKGWMTIVETFRNWNGDGKDHILSYRREGDEMPALYDGHMNKVVTFPYDGYVLSADLFGRGIEDAVIYTGDEARIYSGKPYDLAQTPSGVQLNQSKKLYASTLYPGGEYLNMEEVNMLKLNYDKEQLLSVLDRVTMKTLDMDLIWDWPCGVAYYGVACAYELTKNQTYLDRLVAWVDEYIELGLPDMTVNSCAMGHVLITLYEATEDEKYWEIAMKKIDYLRNDALRFGDNVLQHTVSANNDFPEQAWADTLFMAGFFMLRVGIKTKDQALIEDALNQYYWHINYLQDEVNSLWYHGYNNINKDHMSGFHWGRANAWATYTMSQVLKRLPEWYLYPKCMDVDCALRDQLAAIKLLQTDNGLWRTILDDTSSYEEISASCGIAAAMIDNRNPLHSKYVQKALTGILENISEDGRVLNVSGGTAVMNDRDGYCNVPKKWTQGWGQGLALAFLATVLGTEGK